eukprot:TRINITY_DN6194_c0_g4_i2.p1 TRINITY_DN6194_c0_g4~~TRINITY_DN6194_c0_g4_i2.p1  ORF type:complete len:113 (+),score=14.98 TRINITY_DN6194_c0_g4_i2:616-954(+)
MYTSPLARRKPSLLPVLSPNPARTTTDTSSSPTTPLSPDSAELPPLSPTRGTPPSPTPIAPAPSVSRHHRSNSYRQQMDEGGPFEPVLSKMKSGRVNRVKTMTHTDLDDPVH